MSITRRTQIALAGLVAAGIAAAAVVVVPSLTDDTTDQANVAAARDTDYGPEPEADSDLVTQADQIASMASGTISPDTMINRARTWLTANGGHQVPYSMQRVWKDGYRQDCSGFVSMALALGKPGLNTVGLASSRSVTKHLSSTSQLKKGDLLIDASTSDGDFRHVVIFEKWANASHSSYWAYEQRGSHGTTHRTLSYGIGKDNYDPYRPLKLSGSSSGGGGGSQTPVPSAGWPVLKSGSKGTDVRSAQQLLIARGYGISADSSFGPKTRAAVIRFQKAHSLAADGVIGPKTWAKLIVTVKYGSKGQSVKAAQNQLKLYGYALAVDGSFGAKTKAATLAFQKKHHLAADGVIGPNTWRTLLGTR
ncbi:peptidoglycan-binding protein [Streptomyces sp. DT224]|uniref:C40 family peptidase n=1 Tax=Streptomyces sp. DT224 TaxID=3393426 RepID=UPI003CEA1478